MSWYLLNTLNSYSDFGYFNFNKRVLVSNAKINNIFMSFFCNTVLTSNMFIYYRKEKFKITFYSFINCSYIFKAKEIN